MSLTIEQRLDRMERTMERLASLLHKNLGNLPGNEWGSYEEARGIIGKSKEWYQLERNGKGSLIEGKHWRRVGRTIEYHLPSLIRLKDTIGGNPLKRAS